MKSMIIISLLILFGAITGILSEWVVVVIGFSLMLVLPWVAMCARKVKGK